KDLGSAGARHVVVVPIGFVCDHVEVLYDLDVEAATTARAAGLTLHRATAVNDHPRFIAVLAELVQHHLEAGRGGASASVGGSPRAPPPPRPPRAPPGPGRPPRPPRSRPATPAPAPPR